MEIEEARSLLTHRKAEMEYAELNITGVTTEIGVQSEHHYDAPSCMDYHKAEMVEIFWFEVDGNLWFPAFQCQECKSVTVGCY